MSVADKLNTLQTIKENIKTAIENKGVTVGDAPFTDYASKIDDIEGGSSEDIAVFTLSDSKVNMFAGMSIRGYFELDCKNLSLGDAPLFNGATFSNLKGPRLINTTSLTDTISMYTHTNITEPYLFDTSNVTNMSCMFCNCHSLVSIPQLNTSNVTDMSSMFVGCSSLVSIPELDTSNVTNMSYMFDGCSKLETIPLLDTSNVTDSDNMFRTCYKIANIGGFQGLKVSISMNYSYYITRESMLNIFNTIGEARETITIRQDVADRLTDEDIAIATNKGWTISID